MPRQSTEDKPLLTRGYTLQQQLQKSLPSSSAPNVEGSSVNGRDGVVTAAPGIRKAQSPYSAQAYIQVNVGSEALQYPLFLKEADA